MMGLQGRKTAKELAQCYLWPPLEALRQCGGVTIVHRHSGPILSILCVPTPTAAACFSFATMQKLNPLELCSQTSLAQRLCSAAERGSVSQLSLYTSPSLPNITLGLPATATATAASNVRSAIRLCIRLYEKKNIYFFF